MDLHFTAEAGAPMQLPFGLKMVAPVLMTYGSPAQQQRFLPRIIDGTDWWCQGYSEPGSGSDLASLKMCANGDGGHYVVNGQKTWNTLGQYADWIFCLVRTGSEGRPQAGISFLLIDMKTPGITVRPIVMMDGEHAINEIWFEDVRVPVENLVGEENKGWTYAKFPLGHERTGIAGVGRSKRELHKLKDIARMETANGRPLIEDQRFRDRIAQVELELMALGITNPRVISSEDEKQRVRGAPSADKLIVSARGSRGLSLFLVNAGAAGLRLRGYPTQDGARATDIRLAGVEVGADALIGSEGGALPVIERVLDQTNAVLCAETVGIMSALNEITLEYLKTRQQFGAPIGKFQAVQLHGGMGVVDELNVSHYFKRLTMIGLTFGDTDYHLGRFSDTLLAA